MQVQILVPDLDGALTPIPGLVITALPYDRDSVIAALEQRAPTGRPHTQDLDSLFQAFRGPFAAFSRAAWTMERLARAKDTASRELAAAPAGSAAAGELTARLGRLEDSLRAARPLFEQTRARLAAARDTLWPAMERLREENRRWEGSTWAGYDTIVKHLTLSRLRLGSADTSDAVGRAVLTLSPGRWWVYARSPDPRDPNAEWYWNLPLAGDRISLSPATGRHLSRY